MPRPHAALPLARLRPPARRPRRVAPPRGVRGPAASPRPRLRRRAAAAALLGAAATAFATGLAGGLGAAAARVVAHAAQIVAARGGWGW